MTQPLDITVLAVTRLRGGVSVAGMTAEPDPTTRLRWVRPVKPSRQLLPCDIRYADGALMRPGDAVAWRLGRPRPDPPHVEDVVVDPARDRAWFLHRIDSAERARFCANHLDPAPDDVLVHKARSLCLVRPDAIVATWRQDIYNGYFEARMSFRLGNFATDERGIPVTDLAWRALGRSWLRRSSRLRLDYPALREQLGEIYLVLGRGRVYEGRYWLLVLGVHAARMPEIALNERLL